MTETLAYNQKLLKEQAEQKLAEDLITVSVMVEERKLSSTGAKLLAGEIQKRHRALLKRIDKVCSL